VTDARRLMLLQGIDPLEARRAKQVEERKATTSVSDVLEQFLTTHNKRWSRERVQAEWRQSLLTHLPSIMSLPIVDLTTERVVHSLKPIWVSKNKLAERLRWRLESVWKFAKVHDLVQGENPCIRRGALEHILPHVKRGERQHHHALPYDRIGSLLLKLRQTPTDISNCLTYLIHVAARSGEARALLWSEVSFETRTINISGERMKTSVPHAIPMSTQVYDLLLAQLAKRQPRDVLVFVGMRRRLINEASLIAVLRRLGHQNETVHGFRSSFRTFCAEHTSYPREIPEMALAHHVLGAVEASYQRSTLLEKRRTLERIRAVSPETVDALLHPLPAPGPPPRPEKAYTKL
jgi:integrase